MYVGDFFLNAAVKIKSSLTAGTKSHAGFHLLNSASVS